MEGKGFESPGLEKLSAEVSPSQEGTVHWTDSGSRSLRPQDRLSTRSFRWVSPHGCYSCHPGLNIGSCPIFPFELYVSPNFLWIFPSIHLSHSNGFKNWFALICCVVFQRAVIDNPNGPSKSNRCVCKRENRRRKVQIVLSAQFVERNHSALHSKQHIFRFCMTKNASLSSL